MKAYSNPKRKNDPHALLDPAQDSSVYIAYRYLKACFPECLADDPCAASDEALADAQDTDDEE